MDLNHTQRAEELPQDRRALRLKEFCLGNIVRNYQEKVGSNCASAMRGKRVPLPTRRGRLVDPCPRRQEPGQESHPELETWNLQYLHPECVKRPARERV